MLALRQCAADFATRAKAAFRLPRYSGSSAAVRQCGSAPVRQCAADFVTRAKAAFRLPRCSGSSAALRQCASAPQTVRHVRKPHSGYPDALDRVRHCGSAPVRQCAVDFATRAKAAFRLPRCSGSSAPVRRRLCDTCESRIQVAPMLWIECGSAPVRQCAVDFATRAKASPHS